MLQHNSPEAPGSSNSAAGTELERLLSVVVELTGSTIRSDSIAEMFESSFRLAHAFLSFDVAVGLVFEQNLDLYVSRRAELAGYSESLLIEKIRHALQSQIPAAFRSADMILRTDHANIPGTSEGEALRHQSISIIKRETRTAGMLLFFRGHPHFEKLENQLTESVANQLALVLERIRMQMKMQNLADTDDLTGIWNRRYFRRQLPSEIERSRIYGLPLSLLVLDLDDFKAVNDTFGHGMGDVLLSEVCGTIRETLRPPDLFARFGGDEFAVILPHTDSEGARSVAERIVHRVRELEIPADEGMVRSSVAVGVATLKETDATPSDLMDRADQALYRAKRNGKDRFEL